jgi:secreted protein with Ig-like and vWFA domain
VQEFDLGILTNEQWDAPVETSAEAELVVALNEQMDEQPVRVENELTEEIDLGINTNETISEEILESEPISVTETSVEEMVEAALAESAVETVSVQPLNDTEPEFSTEKYRPNNVLLLLDVSGSMDDDGKMDRLKASIRRLVMMLREVDVLTLIAYNSTSWEVLPPTPVTDNAAIITLVDSLMPVGYTNGVKGMESAYQSLLRQRIEGGNNQLIIATDGKFNSSKFSEQQAIDIVNHHSDKGIVLSILGFGNDREATRLMKKLANTGGGSFLQIESNEDPTEVLTEEIKLRSLK